MLVSTIIGLILLELLVRVVAPQRLDSMYPVFEADKDLVFKLKKNLRMTYSQYEFAVEVTTNSIGLRDREVAPKHPGVYRILGLGDSFSYANGVNLEDTYFKELENCLSVSTGRQIEVINCAVPAYSLLQEIQFLKKYGMTLDPMLFSSVSVLLTTLVIPMSCLMRPGNQHFLFTKKGSSRRKPRSKREAFGG